MQKLEIRFLFMIYIFQQILERGVYVFEKAIIALAINAL